MKIETISFNFDDEMISRTRCDQVPRVRVYEWSDVSVVIGRGGKQELELEARNIVEDGITLYKRPGGGCSVVLDPGNLIVSVVLPIPGLSGIKSAFASISQWLITALAACAIPDVMQLGVSDLVIGDRKIGGSCVYRTKGLLYYSTTLLVDHDPELVDRYLKHPPREPEYRIQRPHRQFMVSLKDLGLANQPDLLRPLLKEELEKGLITLSLDTGCSVND